MRTLLVLALLLAGCSRTADVDQAQTDLERAAIATGAIRDPADTDLTGLYALDTDRVCVVPAASGYRIGATIDYGSGQSCSARGTVTREGEVLHVAFGDDCQFDARMDGDRITFPGRVPSACTQACTGRAALAALEADQLSGTSAEASTLRDARGQLLCGS